MVILCQIFEGFSKSCADAILKGCSTLEGCVELQQMLVDKADKFFGIKVW